MLEECPHCKSKVLFATDVCPSCQADRRSSEVPRSRIQKRPLGVTIVSWLVVVLFGALGLLKQFILLSLPEYRATMEETSVPGFHMLFEFVSSVAMLVIGAGMLRGENWCRWVFAVWMGFGIVLSPFTVGFTPMVILGSIVPGIVVFVLFRRENAKFFTQHNDRPRD